MLETVDLRKEYPGTVALNDVSVNFEAGQVHALIGKNGAGKSTLIKMLAGAITPTGGQIMVDGEPVSIQSPQQAFDKGIATVHQELSLVPDLTVAENILLGRLPRKKILGSIFIDWDKTFKLAKSVLDDMQVDLDVRKKASDLGVAQQQVVEIAKAMSFKPAALMLDEPTSALAHHETASLFRLVKQLAQKGVAIVYITHRLQELKQIADKVTVLRDGCFIGTVDMAETTSEAIVNMMFGEVVRKQRPVDLESSDRKVLDVENLTQANKFNDVNFCLYKGEVLGIAGMLGSGRTELLKAIFGAEKFDSGQLTIAGESFKSITPQIAKAKGLAFTPENRKEEALIQILSTRANMCLAPMDRISVKGFTNASREQKAVAPYIEKLHIKVADIDEEVAALSGGNQQKVVVGNWLATKPNVILFDEPTRGIDVQAKQQIFEVMWELSREGIGSIFVSSELEELVEVCHRILIMKKGRIIDAVDPAKITADELFVMCMEE
ncbi:MAG: sugar ABC transporter ATP-binding protein [Planctomycetes bacterium]|nr:sugar ABC transporter ATP-binding protein [Planctomycetota bacterium]